MSKHFTGLRPEFLVKAEQVIRLCADRGVTMVPYFGVRTPVEQAKLWRQGRTREQIEATIADLKANKAFYLADCITAAGPQDGRKVTNAGPGMSWHQFGEALDCFWSVKGAAEWDDTTGYRVYAEVARVCGLTAGGYFKSLTDWPHIQFRAHSSPQTVMSLQEINDEMFRRYGGV